MAEPVGPTLSAVFQLVPQMPKAFNPADENIAAYPSLPRLLGEFGNPWIDVHNKANNFVTIQCTH